MINLSFQKLTNVRSIGNLNAQLNEIKIRLKKNRLKKLNTICGDSNKN